jgi:hypothetical protein
VTAAKSTLVISRALCTPASMTSDSAVAAPERLGGAVELALLGLGALELHEHALVLDRAHGVAAGLFEQLDARAAVKALVVDAIDDEHAAHARRARRRATRTRRARGQGPA